MARDLSDAMWRSQSAPGRVARADVGARRSRDAREPEGEARREERGGAMEGGAERAPCTDTRPRNAPRRLPYLPSARLPPAARAGALRTPRVPAVRPRP